MTQSQLIKEVLDRVDPMSSSRLEILLMDLGFQPCASSPEYRTYKLRNGRSFINIPKIRNVMTKAEMTRIRTILRAKGLIPKSSYKTSGYAADPAWRQWRSRKAQAARNGLPFAEEYVPSTDRKEETAMPHVTVESDYNRKTASRADVANYKDAALMGEKALERKLQQPDKIILPAEASWKERLEGQMINFTRDMNYRFDVLSQMLEDQRKLLLAVAQAPVHPVLYPEGDRDMPLRTLRQEKALEKMQKCIEQYPDHADNDIFISGITGCNRNTVTNYRQKGWI